MVDLLKKIPRWLLKGLQRQCLRTSLVLCQPWYRELSASQDEVERYCANDYYRTTYRSGELFYWHPVASWFFQDAPLYRGGKILDVGSAYGTLAVYAGRLTGAEVYCTDFTQSYMSETLCTTSRFCFAISNIELDPLPWDENFDAIIFTEVLEHLNFNPVPTLQKLRAALKPGGRLYLSTPDACAWGRLANYPDFRAMPLPQPGTPVVDAHIYQYTMAEVRELAAMAGFSVEREAYALGVGDRHINVVLVPV